MSCLEAGHACYSLHAFGTPTHNPASQTPRTPSVYSTHSPFEVPDSYLDPKLQKGRRQTYYGMASFVDEAVKNITEEVKALGMWNNTLLVLSR